MLPHGLLLGVLTLPAGPALACTGLWAASAAVVTTGLLRPRSTLYGPNLWRAAPQPRVALTFDDGPHPRDTPEILQALATAGVRATFFVVGERARAHSGLLRRAVEEGHEMGVHSDTHPWWFSLAGPGRVRREVREAARTVERLSGRWPRFFRPPMGHKNIFLRDELAAADMRMVTWSVRAFDTLGRSPEGIARAVLRRATPGAILLLHEGVRRRPGGTSASVAALPAIIAGLRSRGLEPVSLGDLRADPRTPAETTAATA